MTRFLLIGDFGGQFPEQLEQALRKEEFDAVLCQGDLVNIKPISEAFKEHGPKYETILGEGRIKEIQRTGLIDARTPLTKLAALGKPVYLVKGNNEWTVYAAYRAMAGEFSNLHFIDFECATINGIKIIGYPYIPPPEERETSEKTLQEFRTKLGKFIDAKTLLLAHYPPYDCDLDKIPETGRYNAGKHIGSEIVARLLEDYHFPLLICGHLEEYQGECSKYQTRVINPGAGDLARYALLEIKDSLERATVEFRQV